LEKEKRNKVKAIKSLRGISAVLETSLGNIKIRLFNRRVPKTVYNFVSLAEGAQAFRENSTKEMKTAPFYDGLIFHRVVPKYVIQTGDPLGTGRGGPGYKFEDEPHPALRHKKAGIVSMANFGPNTNGSQFFITLRPMPDLDFDSAQNVFKKRGNTIFGEVTEGMEVVRKISEVPRDNFDKPLEAVVLKRVIIHRQP
jgi:peptidyl-prolyl cis-trans isomerase A (cyclophilin A)